ncbi:SRPBCC family protein [Pseudomonas benzenivorans]|uniref:SRPBCC family protein n=1 Tax=Pseudomonas benzenivorans TaxID=556533 RepID=A0ABY5HCV0_9PSED|nr:SRPBCC family protein [Pseudomonas benzenivorans]UTW09095.1 SRPBCC family protein [Pseudomonas benzenivorans]
MLSYLLLTLAVIVILLLVLIARQPDQFRVERSAFMAAPAEAVFVQVNDFHNWPQWSPWARRDPAMRVDYQGADAGVGAVYRWSGNKAVGEGSATIIESRASERVRILLDFLKPFKASNEALFSFAEELGGTRVSWSMSGHKNFMAKAAHLLMDMDKLIGGDFEQGLEQLRQVVEKA